MKLSSIALNLLASNAAAAAKLRRAEQVLFADGETAPLMETDPEKCCQVREKALEVIQSAMAGCGAAAANPSFLDQGAVNPNPTCLLLLCVARTAGRNTVLAAGCPFEDPNPFPMGDICNLIPGLLPPSPPVAEDDALTYEPAVDGASAAIGVDVLLANDDGAFGFTLEVVAVTSQPANGACVLDGGSVVYTPDVPDFDDGIQTCEYQACYVGRYDDICDTANISIDVSGAPTGSPTMSPTISRCDVVLEVAPGPFPPPGFDPMEPCQARLTELTLKFNGGDCSQSDSEQNDYCQDSNGGPPTTGQAFVVVEDADFQQDVQVGSTFTLTPSGSKFSSDLRLRVYQDSTEKTKLQELYIQVSCSRTLRLSDKFGSFQVFGFKDPYAGEVSLIQPLEVTADLTNNDDMNATITALTLDVNGNVQDLITNDTVAMPNVTLSFITTTPVDVAVGQVDYNATATYIGGHGLVCPTLEDVGTFMLT